MKRDIQADIDKLNAQSPRVEKFTNGDPCPKCRRPVTGKGPRGLLTCEICGKTWPDLNRPQPEPVKSPRSPEQQNEEP
jgi:ribosomal protein L37AE/L43A